MGPANGFSLALLAAVLAIGPAHALAQRTAPGAGAVPEFPAPIAAASDEVAAALRTLWTSQFFSPGERDETNAVRQAVADAQAVVRRDPEIAGRHVLACLQLLDADDEAGHLWLIPLLELVPGDRDVLAHLAQMLMKQADPVEPEPESAAPPAEIVRTLALGRIASAARGGTELAQQHLLGLLRSPDARVRSEAVRGFYRASTSRSEARRQMRPLLAPEDQHLLYRH